MMTITIGLYLYSFIQFIKCAVGIVVGDTAAKVFDDYHSEKREKGRTKVIVSFVKCLVAFAVAGFLMMNIA